MSDKGHDETTTVLVPVYRCRPIDLTDGKGSRATGRPGESTCRLNVFARRRLAEEEEERRRRGASRAKGVRQGQAGSPFPPSAW